MLLVTAGSAALPFAAIGAARADQVRQQESWVLSALDVPAAWRTSQGHGVLVAVIDSGVDPAVSDLSGSVISGPDLSGVSTPQSNPHWGAHGTWMASLIAGHGHGPGRRDGILGVAPQARILAIRVITDKSDPGFKAYQRQSPDSGQHELAVAIRYAVRHHAGVISMSLGYSLASADVRAAIQYALSRNVVLVASSGNAGRPSTLHHLAPYSFPADYPGVIGVAAINSAGQPAYFSSDNLSVQVAAPGVNVPAEGRGSHYWLVSGTSPACALTAGVAALIKARYPQLTAAQVRRAITESASHSPAGGYNDQVGFGTVDAAAALTAAGHLARTAPPRSAVAGATSAGYFGGGAAKVPRVPVAPRDKKVLYKLYAIAAACLLVMLTATWRFAGGLAARRRERARAAGTPYGVPAIAVPLGMAPVGGVMGGIGPAAYPVAMPQPTVLPGPGYSAQGPSMPQAGPNVPGRPWVDQVTGGTPPVTGQPPGGPASPAGASGPLAAPGETAAPFDRAGLHQWRQMYARDQSPRPTLRPDPPSATGQLWPAATTSEQARAPEQARTPEQATPPTPEPAAGTGEPPTVRAPALPKRVKQAPGASQPGPSTSAREQPGQDLFTRPDIFARGQERAPGSAEPSTGTTVSPASGQPPADGELWAWTPGDDTGSTSPGESDRSGEA
jgi:type VII secretion-associated serine protease mycosin